MNRRNWIPSTLLLVTTIGASVLLVAWKNHTDNADAAAVAQAEPVEAVNVAIASKRQHRHTSTSIGTVLALRSVTLRNELPGTVKSVALEPGAVVEPGQVLVALDVSVEEAELAALKAQAALAETNLARMQRLVSNRAVPIAEAERAMAERDVALAQIDRTKAIIARKTIRAPFRARVGLADVHPGQFLESGTVLTTLQGIDTAAHVDFDVTQQVAAELKPGDRVDLLVRRDAAPITARIVAVDARVDSATRNAKVRARFEDAALAPVSGASVRVRVAQGPTSEAVAVPANALRRGPAGDQVFVVEADAKGQTRAHARTVKSGAMSGNEVLILSGLSAGERVAASGSFKLRENVLVAIIDQPAFVASSTR
jgi:membrane fusion protein (multidrug efflux system)